MAKISVLLHSKYESIKNHNQGSGVYEVLGKDFLSKVQEIIPKITGFSLNYYECEGKHGVMIVACIKLYGKFSDRIQVEDRVYKGFKFQLSEYSTGGYLSDYLGRF
jgi:hypothetical protein